jgi:hypothetical protein
VKTILMELWHSGDTLDGADWAVLEITRDMALELLVLIARFRKIHSEEEKLSSIVYRDLYIPTFLNDTWDNGFGLDLSRAESCVIVNDEKVVFPMESERLLEYPKLYVQEDRVFWKGSYRHEDVIVETAPLLREVIQQIAGVKQCP